MPDEDEPLVQLTTAQIEYLNNMVVEGASCAVIYTYDKTNGWMLVGQRPPGTPDHDGDGVWVDTEGHEHYGG